MRIAWLSDIHLNFVHHHRIETFSREVAESSAEAVLISGDISEAPYLKEHLNIMANIIRFPIFFVLGNHDFYRSSIDRTLYLAGEISSNSGNLVWLTGEMVVRLTNRTVLIGHESWNDGRIGDYKNSPYTPADYFMIEDFMGLKKDEKLKLMQSLADRAADHFKINLPKACQEAENVILLTHVPPFREACWYNGKISDDDHQPYFASKIVGDTIREIMHEFPAHNLTVYCGHTHGGGKAQVLHNVKVYTAEAEYEKPSIQRIEGIK
ncbi:MAG TPA: phosphoesterase [candidate division Zixibacteria bacterium]|nr:phosphoesterase [candidate division Zixibacteria bacterium]